MLRMTKHPHPLSYRPNAVSGAYLKEISRLALEMTRKRMRKSVSPLQRGDVDERRQRGFKNTHNCHSRALHGNPAKRKKLRTKVLDPRSKFEGDIEWDA